MTSVALAVAPAPASAMCRWRPARSVRWPGLLLWSSVPASPAVPVGAIVAVFLLGAWSGGVAERHFRQHRSLVPS